MTDFRPHTVNPSNRPWLLPVGQPIILQVNSVGKKANPHSNITIHMTILSDAHIYWRETMILPGINKTHFCHGDACFAYKIWKPSSPFVSCLSLLLGNACFDVKPQIPQNVSTSACHLTRFVLANSSRSFPGACSN